MVAIDPPKAPIPGEAEVRAVRARTYQLLGALVRGSRPALAWARDLEPLRTWLLGQSDSELLARHYQTFGLNAYPFAGVYLRPDGLASDGSELGAELEALGRATAMGDHARCRRSLAALMSWLPPWAAAVHRARQTPWWQVAALVCELVSSHASDIDAIAEPIELEPFEVGDSAGLRQFAERLSLPYHCGVLITAEEIRELARSLDLPAGFGSRRQRLHRFLESAGAFERGGDALRGLETTIGRSAEVMETLGDAGFAGACRPWVAQADATMDTLRHMAARIHPSRG